MSTWDSFKDGGALQVIDFADGIHGDVIFRGKFPLTWRLVVETGDDVVLLFEGQSNGDFPFHCEQNDIRSWILDEWVVFLETV